MFTFLCSFVFLLIAGIIAERLYRKPRIKNITRKSVFITGTDSGFGHLLALHLDSKGVKVYAGCYTEEGAERLTKSASSRLKVVRIDITNVDSILQAKKEIEDDLDPNDGLWGLVNNAGLLRGMLFFLSRPEDYTQMMNVNFLGTVNVTDVFIPLIKKSGGRIVNVTSIAGRLSVSLNAYTCSKFALEAYTDGVRTWMKRFNSYVATIEPGIFMNTGIINNPEFDRHIDTAFDEAPEYVKDFYGKTRFNEIKRSLLAFLKSTPFYSQFNRPEMVTKAMYHALFAKHPKVRYVCGYDAYFIRLGCFCPDWFVDFIRRMFLSFHDFVADFVIFNY